MSGSWHFFWQRLTALLLIPLVIWFCFALASLPGADHATVVGWIRSPVNAPLLMLVLIVGLYHGYLGVRVVIEDYVPPGRWQSLLLQIVHTLSWSGAVLGNMFWFRILMGGGP